MIVKPYEKSAVKYLECKSGIKPPSTLTVGVVKPLNDAIEDIFLSLLRQLDFRNALAKTSHSEAQTLVMHGRFPELLHRKQSATQMKYHSIPHNLIVFFKDPITN